MKHWIISFILFVIIVTLVFFLRTNYNVHIFNNDQDLIVTKKESFLSSYKSLNEIVLIYIGSSTCVYCNSPSLDSILTDISYKLEDFSISNKFNFNKIGVSQDLNLNEGIKHLVSLNISFNEIAAGNRWRNTLIEKYTNNEFQASLSTPQILITHRVYVDTIGVQVSNQINQEKVLGRYVGLELIRNTDLDKVFRNIER